MNAQIACHPNSYGRFGVRAALDHLATIGIRWLELPIKTAGVASPFGETPALTNESSPADLGRMSRDVEQAGLQLASCNITSGNPLLPGPLQATLAKLPMVADLGALVVAGGGEFSSPEEEQLLVDNLRKVGDLAGALGITYCCETHPGACQNAESMLRLMSRVDHPHIRLNFDTANILFYNQGLAPLDELRKVLPLVRHVHLKDSRGMFKEWDFPALGEGGAVDFVGLREILEAARHSGPLSLEVEGRADEKETPLSVFQERVTKSTQFLRSCGYDW